jgi:hypothetical protein
LAALQETPESFLTGRRSLYLPRIVDALMRHSVVQQRALANVERPAPGEVRAGHPSAVQHGALGSSAEHRPALGHEVDREDFGLPAHDRDQSANRHACSELQLSSSLSTVTGSFADMIQPNAMGLR